MNPHVFEAQGAECLCEKSNIDVFPHVHDAVCEESLHVRKTEIFSHKEFPVTGCRMLQGISPKRFNTNVLNNLPTHPPGVS